MRVRPPQNGSWLFPVMVVAAASVVAFGALGLAMVTGHLRSGGVPAPDKGNGLVTAQAAGSTKAAVAGQSAGAAGLTGNLGSN